MRAVQSGISTKRSRERIEVSERYEVRICHTPAEIAGALRLRHRVFNVELGGIEARPGGIEFDEFDPACKHLVVVCKSTGRTVGTYRLNTIESAGDATGFYSGREFTIEGLPTEILQHGIEIGRACIDKDHRNSKVLFLLLKGLLHILQSSRKRFFFGCCSIFTRNEQAGAMAYRKLEKSGHLSTRYHVSPRNNAVDLKLYPNGPDVEVPSLFEMYLRLGAEVCGPPTIDREFGTIDFFVVLDVDRMNDRYRRMFSR